MTHHPPHHPSSFPKCCRSISIQDSGGFSYQAKEVETQETQQRPNDVNITWQFWRNLTQNIIKSKKEKIIKPNKNTFPFCFYNTVCFFYPVWQSYPSPGVTFSKPGIRNMCFQSALKIAILTVIVSMIFFVANHFRFLMRVEIFKRTFISFMVAISNDVDIRTVMNIL